MALFKLQNKLKNDNYSKLAYEFAERDSIFIIENIIPKLDKMKDGEIIEIGNDYSLAESKTYNIGGSNCSDEPIRNAYDFEQSLQFISYYRRTYRDSLIRNGSINYMQIGGVNYDDYYNMITSNYSALEYDPDSNTNTIYRILLSIPDSVVDEIVIKPGLKAIFQMTFACTLLNTCINIFSDAFMNKAIETLGDNLLRKSIQNGEKLLTNVANYATNTQSSFSMYCNQATMQNPRFGYKATFKKSSSLKNIITNNKTIVIDIDTYYKINNKIN